MREHGFFHVSLAAKCRLLFGLAVVFIIASALFVPWYVSETLIHQLNQQQARSLALIAYSRLDRTDADWAGQQRDLDQFWSVNEKLLRTNARPQLILMDPALLAGSANKVFFARLMKPMKALNKASRYILPFSPVEVGAATWNALPGSLKSRAFAEFQAAASQLAAAADNSYPVLDHFQQEAIQKMREDETLNELSDTRHQVGSTTLYRCIMAVRGIDPGSPRRSLIGIIDMTLPLSADKALLGTRLVILVAGVLAGFLAVLVFYLITQKLILAPVRDLRGLAEQIAHGDLSARADIQTGDEYQELGTAFNDMLEELERSRIELESINRSLDTRLGELAETNVALYESNRLKSEFLANVSHELRTPLTSIIGFADLMRDSVTGEGPMDAGRAARYATNILTSGRMLLEIINDLLDLAKIEAGRIEMHRTVFSLRDVCEALVDFMRPLVEKKMQTLEMELSESLPMMNSDAGKLRQVLYNLLSNAVKYTPEGGTIHFTAGPLDAGERVRIVVADNGPGIAREDQERIFEKFRQLDSSVTREHSGTGLGLAISRELTVMLGGTIRVQSEVDQGATFVVELPMEAPEAAYRAMPILT